MDLLSKYAVCAKEKTDLRIILLGKAGVGKSASTNTILGEEVCSNRYNSSKTSTHNFCYESHDLNHDLHLTVINTPGLFQTDISNEEIEEEIGKSINMAAPGPHVFLIVLQLTRFTLEEKEIVEIIKKMFGEEAVRYTMILFTQGGVLKEENVKIENLLETSQPLKHIISQCSSLEKFEDKYHVFDNKDKDPAQVSGLLQKINRMVQRNGGSFYTNKMFEEAERANQGEIKRLLKKNPYMNPEDARRQAERNNSFISAILGAAAAGGGAGAVVGAVGGPIGAAVGGLVGAVIGTVAALKAKGV